MSRLLRLAAVKDLTGLSRSSIYAHPDFPRPIKIGAGGRAVAWVESEIRSWVERRIEQPELAS